MPNSIIANSIMGRKIDFPEFFQDVIVCFVNINALNANIDVNDNIKIYLKRKPFLSILLLITIFTDRN